MNGQNDNEAAGLEAIARLALPTPEIFQDEAAPKRIRTAGARDLIGKLLVAAIAGDQDAADALVDLTVDATAAIEQLYDCQPETVQEIVRHREHFPVLHTRIRALRQRRQAMLDSLPLGDSLPVKPGTSSNALRDFILCLVSFFESRRAKPREGSDLELRAEALPPLSRTTVGKWAPVLRDWIVARWKDYPDTLEHLANAKRSDRRNNQRAFARALAREKLKRGSIVSEAKAAVLAGKGFVLKRGENGRQEVVGFKARARKSKATATRSALLNEIKDVLKGIAPAN